MQKLLFCFLICVMGFFIGCGGGGGGESTSATSTGTTTTETSNSQPSTQENLSALSGAWELVNISQPLFDLIPIRKGGVMSIEANGIWTDMIQDYSPSLREIKFHTATITSNKIQDCLEKTEYPGLPSADLYEITHDNNQLHIKSGLYSNPNYDYSLSFKRITPKPNIPIVDISMTGQYLLPGTTWRLFKMILPGGLEKNPADDEFFILNFGKIDRNISDQKGEVSLRLVKKGGKGTICSKDNNQNHSIYEIKTATGYQVKFENSSCDGALDDDDAFAQQNPSYLSSSLFHREFYNKFPIFTTGLYSFGILNDSAGRAKPLSSALKLTGPDGTVYLFEIAAINPP